MDDQMTQSIIEAVKSYPENFEWTPSLSMDPVGKEELIRELKNDSRIGRLFIEEIRGRIIKRMRREAILNSPHLFED